MKNVPTRKLLLGAATILALAGCAQVKEMMPGSGPAATATLAPTRGNTASGTVRFVQTGGTVQVSGEIRGLKPNAEHGFHVHEKGDCSSGDGMSAGGHYNPEGQPHGKYDAPRHHAGDLPSLRADAAGTVKFNHESSSFHVGKEPNDVIGKGLIVHRDPDDYSQPVGNAGPRLACAVIVRSAS